MLPIKNKTERTERTNPSPLLNVRREDILYREDIITSATYAVVGITVAVGMAGLGYLFVKQLQK